MRAFILISAVLLSLTLFGTAVGQDQGNGAVGQSGLTPANAWALSRMRGGRSGVKTSPLVEQQALLQRAYLQQQIAAAQANAQQKQAKKERSVASAKKRRAEEQAKRASSRSAALPGSKDAAKP